MKYIAITTLAVAGLAAICLAQSQTQTGLAWAYALNPPPVPGAQPPPPETGVKHVPNSNAAFTVPQTRDLYSVPDWHPDDHPPLPDIVSRGRKPDVRACGYCHLPNGQGRPENASVAGLPAAYIVQQMADYKNGLRKSSEPKMAPPAAMLAIGKNATDADVQAAAAYFSTLKLKPWIRVVEAATVPKTKVAGSMFVAVEGGGTEPIGHRIIEMPEDLERTELRDASSGFIAYVPVGSINVGKELVASGGSKTIRCSICHGADLKGLGNVPSIAGRSPSYITRQLYDIQSGARNGPWTQLMKEAVAKLTVDDMIAIAAYTSSLKP